MHVFAATHESAERAPSHQATAAPKPCKRHARMCRECAVHGLAAARGVSQARPIKGQRCPYRRANWKKSPYGPGHAALATLRRVGASDVDGSSHKAGCFEPKTYLRLLMTPAPVPAMLLPRFGRARGKPPVARAEGADHALARQSRYCARNSTSRGERTASGDGFALERAQVGGTADGQPPVAQAIQVWFR